MFSLKLSLPTVFSILDIQAFILRTIYDLLISLTTLLQYVNDPIKLSVYNIPQIFGSFLLISHLPRHNHLSVGVIICLHVCHLSYSTSRLWQTSAQSIPVAFTHKQRKPETLVGPFCALCHPALIFLSESIIHAPVYCFSAQLASFLSYTSTSGHLYWLLHFPVFFFLAILSSVSDGLCSKLCFKQSPTHLFLLSLIFIILWIIFHDRYFQ